MATRLVLLVAAGAAGTLCRAGLAGLVQNGLGARLPWAPLLSISRGATGTTWGTGRVRSERQTRRSGCRQLATAASRMRISPLPSQQVSPM